MLNSLYNANLKDISSHRYVDLGRIISPTIYVFPPLHLSYPYYLFNLLYLFILQVSFVLSKLSIHQFVRDRIEPIAVTYFGKSNNPKTYTDDPKEELPTALPTGTGTGTSTGIHSQGSSKKEIDFEASTSPYKKENGKLLIPSINEGASTPKKEGIFTLFKKEGEASSPRSNMSPINSKKDLFFGVKSNPLKRVVSLLRREGVPVIRGADGGSGTDTPLRRPRSDTVTELSLYSKACAGDVISGLLSVCLTSRSNSFHLFLVGFNTFVESFFSPACPLRARCVEILCRGLNVSSSMREYIEGFKILNDVRHYTTEALDLLKSSAQQSNSNLQCRLVTIALKLQDYRNLNGRLNAILSSLALKRTEKMSLLKIIWSVLNGMKPSHLIGVSIEDIHFCVNNAAASIALLSTAQKDEKKYLISLFAHYLDSYPPQSWKDLFKSANKIPIFIKNLYKEDISRAYSAYKSKNKDNVEFKKYLADISRILSKPIVTDMELKEVMKECFLRKVGESNSAALDLLKNLKEKNERCVDDDEKLITEMSIVWMNIVTARIGLPMPPRYVQLITVLSSYLFGKSALSDASAGSKMAVAQIGSCEGKNLVVAMTAAYYCKRMQKSVHILMSNKISLDRDYEEFKDFFKDLNISCSKQTSSASHEEAVVTYSLRRDIEEVYRADIHCGRRPFDHCVLIVADIDDLMVHSSQQYSTTYKGATLWGKNFGDFVKAVQNDQPIPASCISSDMKVWYIAESAVKEARKKKKDVDYEVNDNIVTALSICDKDNNEYHPWLECIKANIVKDYIPVLKTDVYCHSLPHTISHYDVVIGFSESTLGNVETEFLSETYGSWTFSAPSFLSTYRGTSQPDVKLITDIRVLSNKKSQENAVISHALNLMKTGPVLIITEDDEKYSTALYQRIVDRSALMGQDKSLLQQATDVDLGTGEVMEDSTKEKSIAAVKISVTNTFKERAIDHGENNESSDDKGISVIMMVFPQSVREWLEWKERTIRDHRHGQYALILNAENGDLNLNEELLASKRFKINQLSGCSLDHLDGMGLGQGQGQGQEHTNDHGVSGFSGGEERKEEFVEGSACEPEMDIETDPNAGHRYNTNLLDDILLIRDRLVSEAFTLNPNFNFNFKSFSSNIILFILKMFFLPIPFVISSASLYI